MPLAEWQIVIGAEHEAPRRVGARWAVLGAKIVGILHSFLGAAVIAAIECYTGAVVDGSSPGEVCKQVESLRVPLLQPGDHALVVGAPPGRRGRYGSDGVARQRPPVGDVSRTRSERLIARVRS